MNRQGFTLIELSIVLVIIGLIVGGALTGQDLIRTAEVRATITQIEKFNTAVNTFRGKYGQLPGDMDAATSTQFGFNAAGRGRAADGDANGIIEGRMGWGGSPNGFCQNMETLMFWVDLSAANMISNTFTVAVPNTAYGSFSPSVASFFPEAKLGNGNYIYVYSTQSANYFGLSAINIILGANDVPSSATKLAVRQVYQIDSKIDDGFPASGNVTATYDDVSTSPVQNSPAPTANAAVTDSATTCYNSTTPAGAYSLSQNGGTGQNCALSFRLQ
jgi:prepilin-type N-terminal cleavage/methylation domain-containing protein